MFAITLKLNVFLLFFIVICITTGCDQRSTFDSSRIVVPTVDTSQNVGSNTTAQALPNKSKSSIEKSDESAKLSSVRSPKMMSSHLSSRAKREILLNPPEKILSVMLTVSPRTSRNELTVEIEKAGGSVVTWSGKTHLVNANVPVGALEAISNRKDVHYVETGGSFGKN